MAMPKNILIPFNNFQYNLVEHSFVQVYPVKQNSILK